MAPALGDRRRRITQLQPGGISWSRDAKTIAFEVAGCQSGEGLYVVPAVGGKPKRLPGPTGWCTDEAIIGWAVGIGG